MAGSSQFPKGLRVLLVDDFHSAMSIRAQLESPSLQYAVTTVTSGPEALSYLRKGVAAFDVVLAESRLVASDEPSGRCFVDAFEETPVVLMSAASTPGDVMRAVRLGAVDFLDKPLSHLKLKNIWQHSVRKMMLKAAGPRNVSALHPGSALAPASAPAAAAFARSWNAAASPSCPALSVGPESPSTPAASADGPGDCSACSEEGSVRNSLDAGGQESFMDALTSALAPPAAPARAAALPAAPLAGGAPPPAVWPPLHAGCVWGTPAAGSVPPPLPGAAQPAAPAQQSHHAWASAPVLHQPTPAPAPVLLKSTSAAVLPVPAATDDVIIPDGFFSDAALGKSASGPLGLQLKKSPSLLNLINSALGSHDSLPGLAAMVF